MPSCFGARRVRAHEQDAPLAPVGVRRPHLLTRDAEDVAVQDRAGGERREIGPRARLREALAPDVLGREDAAAGTSAAAPRFPTP